MTQEELQKTYMEYQMAEQQLRMLHEQVEKIDQQILEVEKVNQCLSDVSNTSAGEEALVPISNGIFFKTKVENVNTFLVNVGAGVVVEKTLDDTKKLIEEQREEIAKYKENLTEQIVESMIAFQELEAKLKKLVESD